MAIPAAVYGIARTILLDPLPYAAEEEIATFWAPFDWSEEEFLHLRGRIPGFATVAAPALLARCGPPGHPRDLLDLPCLRVRYPSGAEPAWEFEKDGEALRLSPAAVMSSNNAHVLRRAALDLKRGGVGYYPVSNFVHVDTGRVRQWSGA